MTNTSRQQCIGRFSFDAPSSLKLAGRMQRFADTHVATLPMPVGGIDSYWKGRLAEIVVPAKTFQLQPGVTASWSARNSTFPESLTLKVAEPVNGEILTASTDAEKGRESLAEQLVSLIVNAYSPSHDHGFCLESGALMTEPSESEEVGLTLQDPTDKNVEFQFNTRTVGKPEFNAISDVEAAKEVYSGPQDRVSVLRDHQRNAAAGLEGREVWLSVFTPDKGGLLMFRWSYPGTGEDSSQPKINIQASAPPNKQAELEAIWESVMTTLRKVPLPPGTGK